ncbi:TIGR03756 family integrating conjugative element protein, partial [Halomonas sp. THAF12]|uniref:TIGR03756 family integrating conjugative element protein n=1 Tax=Halomonas sp. B23F22_10 TaxID=3459515 RepID=UPI00373F80AA
DAHHSGVRFKNVDAIGHPAVALFSAGLGYTCESPTFPLHPHLLSTIDAVSWRENLVEALYPESLTPGMREVGQLGDLWGNVYPRTGFVAGQQNDYRVAAVAAQRAADIVTRTGQPHIYQSLSANQRDGYWPPDPVKEGDASTHKWQPLLPKMLDSCSTFPDGGRTETFSDRIDETGDFAWALWRPYSCCERRGEKLIFHSGG